MSATLTRGKFIPSSKANPCPVCGGTDGKCRHHSHDLDYVHCGNISARKGERIGDWVCIEKSFRGHTIGFRRNDGNNEWNSLSAAEQARRKREGDREREEKDRKNKEAIAQKSLPPKIRHKLYSAILGDLGLDIQTINDLEKRGYDAAEIKRSGFKSFKKHQSINIAALAKKLKVKANQLPGINEFGTGLSMNFDGYLCPIRNFQGQIIGLQARLHKPGKGGRYRWLSSQFNENAELKLPNGELPIAVFHPSSEKPKGIAIVEGTGAKPFYCAERLNYLTIGAAGGQHLGSSQQLKESIDAAIAQHGNIPIIVILDAGWVLNRQVKGKAIDLFGWLKAHYSDQVKVLDWNQIHKSAGDIDELTDKTKVRTLKLESFCKKYQAVFSQSKKGELYANKQFEEWAEARVKLTADKKVKQRWLEINPEWASECDILMIRSGLGTGKTEALLNFLAKHPELVSLLVGYRNSLLENTINRANNPRLGNDGKPVRRAIAAEMVKDLIQNGINMGMDASIKLWAGCADSFHKLDKILSELTEYIVINDEICSVLSHLKTGGTLKGRQQEAIEWCVQATENAAFTIMMDANLSDIEVDFIRKLYPNKRIMVVDNEYRDESLAKSFIFLETKDKKGEDFSRDPKKLPVQLVEFAKKAGRVLWISDSQVSCEVADETLTKKGHQHFRLDRKTSKDELSLQFQKDPAYFLVDGGYDSASLSPSGESGLSIDFNDPRIIDLIQSKHYFDAVCFDVRGIIGINALEQLSARLRDVTVPLYVSCPEFMNLDVNPVPGGWNNFGQVFLDRCYAEQKNLIEAGVCDRALSNEEIKKIMNKLIDENQWFPESTRDSVQLKFEHSNLKLCLKTALSQAGHRIHDSIGDASKHDQETYKQTKEEVKNREAEKIFKARDLTWEQSQMLDAKDVGYDDQCAIKKAKLKYELPEIETTIAWSQELIRATVVDDKGWIRRYKRPIMLKNLDLFKETLKKDIPENGLTPAGIYYSEHTKIQALRELGVEKLLEMTSISSKDPEVRAIVDKYYDEPEFHNLTGIKKANRADNRYVIKMVERFVNYFGFDLKRVKTVKGDKIFAPCLPDKIKPFQFQIDEALKKWEEAIIQEAEEKDLTQNDFDLGCSISDLIYKNKNKIEHPTDSELYTHLENDMQQVEQLTTHDGWNSPEAISEVAEMLELCDDAEALAGLRECEIPPSVFKLAARHLTPAKKQQIRGWVLAQNAA